VDRVFRDTDVLFNANGRLNGLGIEMVCETLGVTVTDQEILAVCAYDITSPNGKCDWRKVLSAHREYLRATSPPLERPSPASPWEDENVMAAPRGHSSFFYPQGSPGENTVKVDSPANAKRDTATNRALRKLLERCRQRMTRSIK